MDRRKFLQISGSGVAVISFAGIGHAQSANLSHPKIVSEITAPGSDVKGLAHDGTHLWTTHWDDEIYEIDTEGTIQSSLETDPPDAEINDITIIDDSLYTLNYHSENRLDKMSTNGELLERYVLDGYSRGLTTDGEYLFTSADSTEVIKKRSLNGNQVSSLTTGGNYYGLAYDGEYLWGTTEQTIDKFTTDGNITQQYNYPKSNGEAGRDIAHDGQYLWISSEKNPKILQLSTDIATPEPKQSTESAGETDADGDGVSDSEDYAPQDPDVQEKSDLDQNDDSTGNRVPGFGIVTTSAALGSFIGYQLFSDSECD